MYDNLTILVNQSSNFQNSIGGKIKDCNLPCMCTVHCAVFSKDLGLSKSFDNSCLVYFRVKSAFIADYKTEITLLTWAS